MKLFPLPSHQGYFYVSPHLGLPEIVLLAVVGDDNVLPVAVRQQPVARPERGVLGGTQKDNNK